jgi:hypothetical protein
VSDHAEERTRLLHGPYAAPACRVGDVLTCERYGESVVAEMSAGSIPWPVCRAPGRPRLILCGDLARAVRVESEAAVAHWWGVDKATVCKWRRVLGVPKSNAGSRRLYARGMRKNMTPAVRTVAGKRPWLPEEDALLGTMTDREVARRLGRTKAAVTARRERKGIPPVARRREPSAR